MAPRKGARLNSFLSPHTAAIVKKYKDGMSAGQLASEYGVSAEGMRAHLIKAGVAMRPRGGANRAKSK